VRILREKSKCERQIESRQRDKLRETRREQSKRETDCERNRFQEQKATGNELHLTGRRDEQQKPEETEKINLKNQRIPEVMSNGNKQKRCNEENSKSTLSILNYWLIILGRGGKRIVQIKFEQQV
jgi:hypothetical protein